MNRSAPPGPVVPVLVYEDVGDAADWLCRTFGFRERLRYGPEDRPEGAQLAIGAGSVFLVAPRVLQWDDRTELRPPRPGETSASVHVHVEHVDRHHARAAKAGARILHEPETFPFGERQYSALDPGGHRWTFSESVADVAPEDWGGRSVSGPRA